MPQKRQFGPLRARCNIFFRDKVRFVTFCFVCNMDAVSQLNILDQ